LELLIVDGIDITHFRLIELTRLADQSRPFYDWVETQFQDILSRSASLDELLQTSTSSEILTGIKSCYEATGQPAVPFLFDGVGRTYPHHKACFYFFAWLIRDAPQQRLSPLIQRIVRSSTKKRTEVEIALLTALIVKYRKNVRTFSWDAIREVIVDRLEGSRRSLKGHEKETVVRTALVVAIQNYFAAHSNYGAYTAVEIPNGQVKIGNETFDISANLLNESGTRIKRILIPIKTRETEGGGHSHLFSRDLTSAINAVHEDNPNDYLAVIIVAKNWSQRETENINTKVDHLAVFDLDPGEFSIFSDDEQKRLNGFIQEILDDTIQSKASMTDD
jgi:hypothetical protein